VSSRSAIPVLAAVAAVAALATPTPAAAITNSQIPGLQVALRSHGLYHGRIDGIAGPRTRAAVRAFQQQRGLHVDGIAGPQTRRALGPLGTPLFGSRVLRLGHVGWDVSVLQFLLAGRGLLTHRVDGRFGAATQTSVRQFQRSRGLRADGVAGPATIVAFGAGAATLRSTSRASSSSSGGGGGGTRHVVRPGENLTSIAARYGTSVTALARANGLDPARYLVVGTRLRVPRGRGTPTASSAGSSTASVRASIDRWSAHYGVDARLVKALAWMESGFQNHVVSPAGAFGVMQVTPATWAFVELVLMSGRNVPRTADGNVRVGVAFLRHMLRVFRGDERKALAAYYQGAKSVQTVGILPGTRRYIANILALKSRF
jgi:peptidoglycan hydrolase-like protein with peptidoglycan-binding domain